MANDKQRSLAYNLSFGFRHGKKGEREESRHDATLSRNNIQGKSIQKEKKVMLGSQTCYSMTPQQRGNTQQPEG